MSFFKVKGIHKKYSGEHNKKVLKGVSFDVPKGNHVFVIGETGSGKSTLLKIIYGVETPDNGSVKFNGQKLVFQNRLIPGFEGMKFVEQDFNLKKFNSVRLAIESRLRLGLTRKEKKDKTNELLDLFQLRKLASKQILQISGGQQQRVALAQAFAKLPKLLLLDEPFAHLDPQLKTNIFKYLKKHIAEDELTVITVTHDYLETLKHADSIVVLQSGKIVQKGNVSELYNYPISLYVAGLLGSFSEFIIGKDKWFLRPEYVKISEKGKYTGIVKSIRFCGGYSEIEIEVSTQVVVAITSSTEGIALENEVCLTLNLKALIKDQLILWQ